MRDTTLSDLRRLLADAKAARAPFEPDWQLNLAFFEGEQWVYWDGYTLARPVLRADRVLVRDNRIQPVIRTEVAKLSKYRPTYLCTPHSGGDEDLAAAELSQQVLEYLWDHLAMRQRFQRALLWSRAICAGFLKVVWDRTIGASADVLVNAEGRPIIDPGTGRPMRPPSGLDLSALAKQIGVPPDALRRERVHRGDIRVVPRSPFEIYPDPLAETFDDLEWLIEETVQSQEHVFQRYRVVLEPDTPANPGMVQSALAARTNRGTYRGVRVYEYWRKPCSAHPNGYRAVWAADRILEVDESPADPLPYIMLRGIDVPGRFWPTSLAEQLRPLQTELNKVKSQLAENRNRVGNATLVLAEGAVEDKAEFERQMSAPGGVAYYRPSVQGSVPTYLQPPQMPAYLVQEIDRIEAAIQEIAGQHEVSSAQVPAGVTAASAINLLQEADDTRLGPSIGDLEDSLARCGRKQLQLVARFYDDQRTITIAGDDDDDWSIVQFRGDMLRGHTKVDVQAGSMFPRSQAAKQAAMESTMTMFLQNGVPFRQQDLAKFLKAYDVGGVEHLVASQGVDQAQTARENRRLAAGVDVQIHPYDDDEAHIAAHEAFQKTARYERLPRDVRDRFDRHVQAHRDRAQAQAAAASSPPAPTDPAAASAPATAAA